MPTQPVDVAELRRRVDSHYWYHTIDLGHGVVTPGHFDLRPIVDQMPWPEIEGKRCLDVGTYDGYLAFELERRGAAEVVATDIANHEDWDWPPDVRARGGENLAKLAGPDKSLGFRIAKEALGSKVERLELSVYDLDPDELGRFDVVVCGSLMLHLRDPQRALEAIRRVCAGEFLSAEEIDLPLTLALRKWPVARLRGTGALCQWWIPNAECHRQMLKSAGFGIIERSKHYTIPFGVAHPPLQENPLRRAERALQRRLHGDVGSPTIAARCRPAVDL